MVGVSRTSCFFSAWAATVVLIGGALTSFHQPFRLPEAGALSPLLATSFPQTSPLDRHWSVTHLLSGGCGCSRRVMLHLLQRRPLAGVSEKILLIGDDGDDLPGTAELLASLRTAGFDVAEITQTQIPTNFNVHGVPLLMVRSPDGKVDYLGGYGPAGDREIEILHQVRAGTVVAALPVLGCAVGSRTKRLSDPFRLKY